MTGVVEIINEKKIFVGTGMVAGDFVITCHHVIANIDPIIRFSSGEEDNPTLVHDTELAKHDIALLSIDKPGTVLPIEAVSEHPKELVLRGYGLAKFGYGCSVPVRASVSGPTSIKYRSGEVVYELNSVLRLQNADIEAGFSGGPAFDSDGMVVGVIVANFQQRSTAYVVPFKNIQSVPTFYSLLDANRQLMPRVGGHMDIYASLALLSNRSLKAIDWLEELGLFDKEWLVERAEARENINEFLYSNGCLLPIIGPSGTGKTFLLAHLALTAQRPSLFIVARDIQSGSELSEAVKDSLGDDSLVIERCISQLSKNGRWIIILDGLNELPLASVEQKLQWLQRGVRWARDSGAALVISCRLEVWQLIEQSVPKKWFGKSKTEVTKVCSGKSGVVALGEFTVVESEQARKAYGLSNTWSELREPAIMRAAAALSEQGAATRWQVIDKFICERCEVVARVFDNARDTSAIITILENIAMACLESDDGATLSIEEVTSDVGAEQQLVQAFVNEALLVRRDRTLRFSFDWVMEHLQGRCVSLDKAIDRYERGKPASHAAICAALEFTVAGGKVDVVQAFFPKLIPKLSYSAPDLMLLRSISLSEELVKIVISSRDWLYIPEEVYRFLGSNVFSIPQRIDFARLLLPHTYYYPWRFKDIKHQPRAFERQESLFYVFKKMLMENSKETVANLIHWIGDVSVSMKGNEGSPNSVATAVILEAIDKDHQTIIDLLAQHWPKTDSILRTVFSKKPDLIVKTARRWLSENNLWHALDGLIAEFVSAKPELINAATLIYRRSHDDLLAARLVTLGCTDDDLWRACESGVREGRIQPIEVIPLMENHLLQVLDWFKSAISLGLKYEVIEALGYTNAETIGFGNVIKVLQQFAEDDAEKVAGAVEELLFTTKYVVAVNVGLWALAVEMASADSDGRNSMVSVAYGSELVDVDRTLRDELAKKLAQSSTDDESLEELVYTGIDRCNYKSVIITYEEALARGQHSILRLVWYSATMISDPQCPLTLWIEENFIEIPEVQLWLLALETESDSRIVATKEYERLVSTPL